MFTKTQNRKTVMKNSAKSAKHRRIAWFTIAADAINAYS
jgi:hypothetical protein